MTDLKVSLPTPCSESWDDMAPRGCNRHCASCDTLIHDLSLMTVDETQALLDSGEEVCVRAAVRPDGTIRTATWRTSRSRRIVATVGASLSLATAACQTAQISPRYEVTGTLYQETGWAWEARLVSSTGKVYKKRVGENQKFKFKNLAPGTYELSFDGSCVESTVQNIIVNDDLDLGVIKFPEVQDCIVIGKLMRDDDVRNG